MHFGLCGHARLGQCRNTVPQAKWPWGSPIKTSYSTIYICGTVCCCRADVLLLLLCVCTITTAMQLALNYVHTAVCHAAKPGSRFQATCTAYRRADTHICRIRAAVRIIFVSVYACVCVCIMYVRVSMCVRCCAVSFITPTKARSHKYPHNL